MAGPGIKGVSTSGNGLAGVTNANSTLFTHAGVQGLDASTSTFKNAGVFGSSLRGVGVAGTAGKTVTQLVASGDGIYGISSVSNGVHGQISSTSTALIAGVFGEDLTSSSLASGIRGTSTDGNGVRGESTNGNGTEGVTQSAGASGVYGEADSTAGFGVAARCTDMNGACIALFAEAFNAEPALFVHKTDLSCTPQCNPAMLVNAGGADIMSLDVLGNMILSGTLTQSGTPLIATSTREGRKVVSYGIRSSQPDLEDFGEATLVEGRATVQLDPAFAAAIDPKVRYLVFITPDGPSAGLYVESKGPNGFVVRENSRGESSLTFDYRIVAKPFDTDGHRLPVFAPRRFPTLTGPRSAAR